MKELVSDSFVVRDAVTRGVTSQITPCPCRRGPRRVVLHVLLE